MTLQHFLGAGLRPSPAQRADWTLAVGVAAVLAFPLAILHLRTQQRSAMPAPKRILARQGAVQQTLPLAETLRQTSA